MTAQSRIIRHINNAKGTVSNRSGDSTDVVFSLIQRQTIIDGVPGSRSATGEIRFSNAAVAQSFFSSGELVRLSGGGIEARILLLNTHSFRVSGPVSDLR